MVDSQLPTLLVLSTVHAADDTRIREKLIRSLAGIATVAYATRSPAPSDGSGLEWIELRGGRLRRNLTGLRLLFDRRFDAAVVHDPELIPAAILATVLGRRRVVIDIHEHIPGLFATRDWVPRVLQRPLARIAAGLLHLAERVCPITLAEPGYQALFRRRHPVFANYPDDLPEPASGGDVIVYVGDVTVARGMTDLVAALDLTRHAAPLRVIGRVDDAVGQQLDLDDDITVYGRLPHHDAMELVNESAVGVSPLRDLPNYRYSLPTKTIEYLAMGLVVVATDLPGTRDAIGELDGVILVPPGDPVALADGLDRAFADEGLRAAAAANARVVREQFRWPAKDVADFYRGMLTRT
jgi:glycosyltransferase involved in cell wall biosynthesis